METMYSQWLNDQFKHNPDKKKAQLARALGLEAPAISKILNGSRQLKAHELEIIKHFFDTEVPVNISIDPSSGVYEHKLESTNGQAAFYDSRKQSDSENEWMMPEPMKKAALDPHKTRIFKSGDDAMAPEFRSGEFVLVNTGDKTPPGIFMITDGYSQMIRQCELLSNNADGSQIKVSAHSKNFIPQILFEDDLHIIGRVVGKAQTI